MFSGPSQPLSGGWPARVTWRAFAPTSAATPSCTPSTASTLNAAAGKICRGAGISEQTYYKWRREYGGLKIDQAKRLKELERENERLKKAVSELTLDKQILKEALSRNVWFAPSVQGT